MRAIQAYLSSARAGRNAAKLVVLGNEAADLDSMASSIAYGYLLSMQNNDTVVLPVMPIPRSEFKLRTEAVYVFAEAAIPLEDVVFFDEVDFDNLMRDGAGLVLVDHNKLAPGLIKYHANVCGVLDHHIDEGMYKGVEQRIIKTIGSTASLVGMEFKKAGVAMDADIATLLGGTILLDTVNLNEKAGRVTSADNAIAAEILPHCPLSREEFFGKIQKEKYNVAGLSTNDLLRKDYKEFHFDTAFCGIASALLPIKQWLEMDKDLFAGFAGYAAARNLDVLISMNAYVNPDFKRDLVLYCTTKDGHDKLFSYLGETSLHLTAYAYNGKLQGEYGWMSFHAQGNLDISRKKLQPLLADFYCNKAVL